MKKAKRIKLIVVLLLCNALPYNTQAQVSPLHENIIPPSPQASDLGKYSEATVNHQTGVPNISIPIHSIKGKDISHNIVLSYDASGRKVAEIASWTGLGWTLQAGGVITRTVRGLPDENSNGYFSKYPDWKQNHEANYFDPGYDPKEDRHAPETNFLKECYEGSYDLLPDVYSFNFNGHQGQIMFDATTKKPMVIPHQDMKVERTFYDNNGIYMSNADAWTITTSDGAIYNFEHSDIETTNSYSPSGFFISAWHLSSIENYNQTEKISFTYNTINNVQGSTRYSVQSTKYLKTNSSQEQCNYPGPGPLIFDDQDIYTTKYLTSIDYSFLNTPVLNVILYSTNPDVTPRLDKTPYTPKLNILNGINVNDLIGNSTIKTFSMNYDYFGVSNKRLKLLSIQEVGKPPHTFEYNEVQNLPHYDSFAQDHWGYYNSKTSNTGLIPKTPLDIELSGEYHPNLDATADRTSNDGSLIYLLTKVNYPAGGSSEYEYESNASRIIAQNCKEFVSASVKAWGDEIAHGPMDALELQIRNMFDDGDTQLVGGLPNVQAVRITLPEAQNVKFYLTASPGTFAIPTTTLLFSDPLPLQWDQSIPFSYGVNKYLNAGDYILVSLVAEDLNNVTMKTTMQYYDIYPTCIKSDIIGGARIKKTTIKDGDSSTDNDIVYEYQYIKDYADYLNTINAEEENNSNNNVSGGPIAIDTTLVIIDETNTSQSEMLYEYSTKVHSVPNYYDVKICGDLVASAYSFNPFAKTLGNHVGYDEVSVIKNGIENGLSVYKYRNGTNPNFRSQPISEITYEFDDSNNQLVKQIQTDYEYTGHYYGDLVEGLKVDVTGVELYACVPAGTTPGFEDCEYYNIYNVGQVSQSNYSYGTSFIGLSRKTETTFVGNLSQEIVTEYSYDFVNNTSLINSGIKITSPTLEITRNTELNKSIYKRFNYLYAYADVNGGIGELKNRYVTDFMVSQESGIIEGEGVNEVFKKTSGQVIYPTLEYSKVLKNKILQFESDIPLTETNNSYSFNRYVDTDANVAVLVSEMQYDPTTANIINVNSIDDIDQTYIWGYDGMYPVAKIVGASYAEVSAVLGSNLSTINASTDPSVILTQIETLRNHPNMGNAQVTTYTYQPNVGIQVMIDPNGRKTEYVYDNFNRLRHVKDHDGNIVKMHEYNYKN